MAERDQVERLNDAIDAIIAGGAASSGPAGELLDIARALRRLPRERFRAELRDQLKEKTNVTAPSKLFREGFHTVTPYLIVQDPAKLIDFLQEAFGAQERMRVPGPEGSIMHAEVRIGDSMLEMGGSTAEYPPRPGVIHMYVPDVDATYRSALAAGAVSTHEPVNQFYGDREAGVKDLMGNQWYIATRLEGSYIPEGVRTITPYLHPKGADSLIDFMKRALGAEEAGVYRSPEGTVVHAQIRVGDSIVEMGEAHGPYQPAPMALHLYVPDTDAIYERAIAAGATSIFAPRDEPYGDRAAGVTDAHGNSWFFATPLK